MEFSEYFLEICKQNPGFTEIPKEDLQNLSKNYWTDLTAHLSFYFSNEDRLEMTKKAAELLMQNKTSNSFSEAWKLVIVDFSKNQFWNYQPVVKKPVLAQTEEQKIFWKLFKYGWAFFQSMIVLKIAVYYFGLESASNPDQVSSIWVWIFFSISFSSLVFFAYRNRHDKN